MKQENMDHFEAFVYRPGADKIEELSSTEQLPELLADPSNVIWVDLRGDTRERAERSKTVLLDIFHFHPLTVEDCMETRNQPKVEGFNDYLYFIVHGIRSGETNPSNFATRELDGFLGKNFVVTYHVERFLSIKEVKKTLRTNTFPCTRGASYLLHQILDHIVDMYLPVIDEFDVSLNKLEDDIFAMRASGNRVLEKIMILRRSVARLHRISARQMEVLYRLAHGEFPQIPTEILPFYRDVHDHLQRVSDLSEGYRDLINSMFDIHFSVIATRTNDVMKTLAVVSAIILPLSLIAGIYGMNFENMPELHSPHGYYLTIAAMALITFALILYFWRKGWIFAGDSDIGLPPTNRTDTPDRDENARRD